MPRPTLILSLLAAGGLGAALGGLSSCASDCDVWSEPEPLELGIEADLLAVSIDPDWDGEGSLRFHAVGAGGVIVAGGDSITSVSPVAADLRGVAYHWSWVIAVGDAGTIVRTPRDGSGAWELVDADVAQDLYAVTSLGQFALALGDDVVIVHDSDADTWTPAPPPPGGWGSLRASFRDGYDGTYWAFGLGGVAWSSKDLQGAWTRVDLGIGADLVAASSEMKVFGSGGTILYRRGGRWNALASDVNVDFISAAANGLLLTGDGRLVSTHGTTGALEPQVTLEPEMTAVAVRVDEDLGAADTPTLVVGAGGRAVRLDFDACEVRL